MKEQNYEISNCVSYHPLKDPFGENLPEHEKELGDGVKRICDSMEKDDQETLFDNCRFIGLSEFLTEWEKRLYIHSPEFLRQT